MAAVDGCPLASRRNRLPSIRSRLSPRPAPQQAVALGWRGGTPQDWISGRHRNFSEFGGRDGEAVGPPVTMLMVRTPGSIYTSMQTGGSIGACCQQPQRSGDDGASGPPPPSPVSADTPGRTPQRGRVVQTILSRAPRSRRRRRHAARCGPVASREGRSAHHFHRSSAPLCQGVAGWSPTRALPSPPFTTLPCSSATRRGRPRISFIPSPTPGSTRRENQRLVAGAVDLYQPGVRRRQDRDRAADRSARQWRANRCAPREGRGPDGGPMFEEGRFGQSLVMHRDWRWNAFLRGIDCGAVDEDLRAARKAAGNSAARSRRRLELTRRCRRWKAVTGAGTGRSIGCCMTLRAPGLKRLASIGSRPSAEARRGRDHGLAGREGRRDPRSRLAVGSDPHRHPLRSRRRGRTSSIGGLAARLCAPWLALVK